MAKDKHLVVSEELHRRVKRRSVDEGRSVLAVTADALREYLSKPLRRTKGGKMNDAKK